MEKRFLCRFRVVTAPLRGLTPGCLFALRAGRYVSLCDIDDEWGYTDCALVHEEEVPMAEDRTPRIEPQSGLVPCPPDDVPEKRDSGDEPTKSGRKPRVPEAENRRRSSDAEIPFRIRSV